MNEQGRFQRQELLFGKEGQARIAATSVCIVGAGGLGTQVVKDLALLGTQQFTIIEPGELKETGRNRYVGHFATDPIPGTSKIAIVVRSILAVNPEADVRCFQLPLEHPDSRNAIAGCDVIFGCLDREGSRLLLNELCASKARRFIDLATEILPASENEPLRYGGRVFVLWEYPGCLDCCDVLDKDEASRDLASPEELINRRAVYGIDHQGENGSGPSVVTLNGVIASIATTEFMVAVTGLRQPQRLTEYRADLGRFHTSNDAPRPNCYTCALATRKSDPC